MKNNFSLMPSIRVITLVIVLVLSIYIVIRNGLSGSNKSQNGVVYASARRGETLQEAKEADAFTQAGLTGDRSQIPVMMKVLQEKPYPHVAEAAMQALSRLGATEALPIIDGIAQGQIGDMYGKSDSYNVMNAKVARARLLAESSVSNTNITDIATQAATKTNMFFQQLGISPEEMNKAVAAYFQHGPEEKNAPAPLELKAMRELADMAYDAGYSNYNALPAVSQINFKIDAESDAKVQLAPLSHSARAAALIQDLSRIRNIGDNEAFKMRLAISQGIDASEAATSELHIMEQSRSKFSSEGFVALLDVVGGVGDLSKDALLAHFSQDQDPAIAEEAKRERIRLSLATH